MLVLCFFAKEMTEWRIFFTSSTTSRFHILEYINFISSEKCITNVNHISWNLKDGERERGGWGGCCHSLLFVTPCLKKRILNVTVCTGKHMLAEFENTFGTIVLFLFFCFFSSFSCVYTSCKQSRSCFHGNIYLCEEFINPFS